MVASLGAWNIRGLNSPLKQKSIHHWINKNKLDIVGILEPRILLANMAKVEKGLGLSSWQFVSNMHHGHLCRILVCWNPKRVSVCTVHTASQWVTCDVLSKEDGSSIRVTFVYGLNLPVERRAIWSYLISQKLVNTSVPWGILGDFNAILSSRDRSSGDQHWHTHMDEFPSCISQAELIQISLSGIHFTWDNGQHGEHSILKKLDWVWGNHQLLSTWSASKAEFQARLVSDHSPMVLLLAPPPLRQKARFKFLNLWTQQEGYEEAVKAAWAVEVHGNPISRLTSKLRLLKGFLKSKLGHHTHDMTHKVIMAKEKWHAAQCQLDRNPRDQDIRISLQIQERW
ncbi:hypothetical protein OIU78_015120 [Salix suchowensis]|nr:hypothetical protein OIU78_015120 [Salix suchowensis]